MSTTGLDNQVHDDNHSVVQFKAVPTVIALAASTLIGWAVSLIPSQQQTALTAGLTAGLTAALFLLCHANVGGSRSATVIKATAWFALVVTEIIIIALAIWCDSAKAFVLVGGFAALIFLAAAYGVARADQ